MKVTIDLIKDKVDLNHELLQLVSGHNVKVTWSSTTQAYVEFTPIDDKSIDADCILEILADMGYSGEVIQLPPPLKIPT